MRKIFFFDLDGTLLDTTGDNPCLLNELRQTLYQLRMQGHVTAVSTARPYCFIETWLPNIFDCLVLLNGAYIQAGENVLLDKPLEPHEIRQIDALFSVYHSSYICIGNNKGWARNISQRHQKRLDSIYQVGPGFTQFNPMPQNEKVYSIDMFFETSEDFKRIEPVFYSQNWLTLNYSLGDYTGDVYMDNRTKATAAQLVLDYYGISVSHAYAFGDGINDVPLFHLVQHTCAVQNAKQELKDAASFISSKPTGAGVLQGLHYWGFGGMADGPLDNGLSAIQR